jgi:hypothetical protein
MADDNLRKKLWRVRPRLHVFGHTHEAHGEEKLAYDAVAGAYEGEGALCGKAGLLSVLKPSFPVLWSFVMTAKLAKTQLVNAAILGAWRDNVLWKPIVVRI